MRTSLSRERLEFLAKDYRRGFIKHCGLEAVRVKRGLFESRVLIGENHRTQDNFIHAGLMATMADHTAGYAAFTVVSEEFRILTIEFKINFLKPAFGNALRCRSRVMSQGKQIIVAESKVYDVREDRETQAAAALVTLMAVPAEKLAVA
ncbi:MAG: PaaI family thioesterase [Deltaproteobacteria bacterium]|nr:PaaI family thioesterase [Deltaproteobacteria bacterium]RLB30331.1 MAG: PaaI family thioesterase [Deltaproteobacteria bacterium]